MKTSPCPPFLTSTRKLSATVIAQALFFLTAPLSAQVLYDFNTPGQLADNFYAGSQGSFGTQTASGGLSDTGWVPNGAAIRGWAVTNTTFSPLTPSFTQSIYFQYGSSTSQVGEAIWVGIGRSTNPDVTFDPLAGNSGAIGPASLQSLQIGIGPRTSSQEVRIYYATVVDGVNTNLNQPGNPTASLTNGNWYYLQVDYNLLPQEDGFDFTVELFNSSTAGVVSGASLLSYSASVVNANLTSGNVHALFGGRNTTAGVLGIDNFYVSAIPEASTLAMLAGVAGLVALISIRRRLK